MIVIDASLALSWVLGEAQNDEADAALDHVSNSGAYAPGNFQTEVINALLKAQRSKRIDAGQASAALADIFALPITIDLPDAHPVMMIGREYSLTAYDAAYLALATQAQLPLASIDAVLRKAASKAKLLWSA